MYNLDRRLIAKNVYSLLKSLRKTAIIIQVSHSTIARWLKNSDRKSYSRIQPHSKCQTIIETIRLSIQIDPFISVCKLRKSIFESIGISVSRELIRTCIVKLGMSRKKARFFGKPKNLEDKTREFLVKRDLFVEERRHFYSLDETSFGRNGKQMMGYSPRGKQLRIQKVQPRMTTTSSLVISSQNGIYRRQEVEGSFNTDRFMCFLDDLHLPLLAVILLDNVSFHHSKRVKSWAAENQIDLLYTPPYSPWFNPIEGIFSIVKRSFYKHGIIKYAFDDVKEHHCKAFFNKSFRESGIRE